MEKTQEIRLKVQSNIEKKYDDCPTSDCYGNDSGRNGLVLLYIFQCDILAKYIVA